MKAIHNKTGNEYFIDDVVINTTNGSKEDQVMILYHNQENQKFVREGQEFLTKFTIENKDLLYKAIELVQKQVEDFNQRIAPTEAPKFCLCSNCEQDVLNCNEDCDCSRVSEDCDCSRVSEDYDCSRVSEDCDCSCNNEKPFIGELVDPAVFVTYKQRGFTQTDVPLYVVKEEAYQVLDKVFTKRCRSFVIEEKTYDNATNEYFLIGLDDTRHLLQVARITKECYEALEARVDLDV